MFSGYLHIPKAKTILFSPPDPLSDQVSSHKSIPSLASHNGKNSQWLVLVSQYDIGLRTSKAIKSQAIAVLLTQFPGEEECSLSEEILKEVVVAELLGKKWTMRFDGDTMPLSFKLEFSYSNNASEYEAYLTGLAIALNI